MGITPVPVQVRLAVPKNPSCRVFIFANFVSSASDCTIDRVMQPNSDQNRGLQVPNSRGSISPQDNSRQAAADLMRQQISQIYEEPQPNEQVAQAVIQDTPGRDADDTDLDDSSTYARSYDDHPVAPQNNATDDQWRKYHSAWQKYYQMYYDRYYQLQNQNKAPVDDAPKAIGSSKKDESLTQEEAVDELRSELLKKVKSQTKKISSSRHFRPAIVSLVVAFIFIFLQYNQLIFANLYAFATPSSSEAVNNYINPTTEIAVSNDPTIIIPKIAVEAPVVYGMPVNEAEPVVQSNLERGVVHYPISGASAVPGQVGNTVILGHSANDVFAAGDYKFIFLRLERLQKGDSFYLNYNGKRYSYVVTETKVVNPDQVSTLAINNGKPMATLVTCTPIGTAAQRLLVIGEQVSPDPAKATAAPEPQEDSTKSSIGGATTGFFERLFGGAN